MIAKLLAHIIAIISSGYPGMLFPGVTLASSSLLLSHEKDWLKLGPAVPVKHI